MELMKNRIRQACRDAKISNVEIAEKLDVSEAAVSKWWKTGNISRDHLPGLAAILGKSIDYLMTGRDSVSLDGRTFVPVPVLEIREIPDYINGNHNNTRTKSMVLAVPNVGDRAFGFRVTGDSMRNPSGNTPNYPEGVICVCDPDLSIENGKRCLIQTGEDSFLFREAINEGGEWFLKPINPQYPIVKLDGSHNVIGVVVQAIHVE